MRRIEYTTTAKGSVHMKPKASERLEKLTQRIKGVNWKEIFAGRTARGAGQSGTCVRRYSGSRSARK